MHRFLRTLTFLIICTAFSGRVAAQEEYFKIEDKKAPPVQREKPSEKKESAVDDFKDLPFIDKLRLGGSFGLRIGQFTTINVAPAVGVEVVKNLTLGLGVNYIFMRNPDYFIPSGSTSFYGGRAFAMYSLFPNVHLQGEYELMNVKFYNHGSGKYQGNPNIYERTWLGSPMLGAGYTQPIGGRFIKGVHMTLLYNFNYQNHINPSINYNYYSPGTQVKNISHYSSPFVFRVTLL